MAALEEQVKTNQTKPSPSRVDCQHSVASVLEEEASSAKLPKAQGPDVDGESSLEYKNDFEEHDSDVVAKENTAAVSQSSQGAQRSCSLSHAQVDDDDYQGFATRSLRSALSFVESVDEDCDEEVASVMSHASLVEKTALVCPVM